MSTPQSPTQQELMEFVDGTLPPERFREIEHMAVTSAAVRREIALHRMMRKSVAGSVTAPGRNFTAGIMTEIVPQRKNSFWLRLAGNSSNIFAMVLVLSLIGIVLTSAPGTQNSGKGIITKTMESYTNAWSSVMDTVSGWGKQYSEPVQQISTTSSGKLMLLALSVFIIFAVLDELFGKRFIQLRNKH